VRASDVFMTFCDPGSMLEVNLSSFTRRRLRERLGPALRFTGSSARKSAPVQAQARVGIDVFDEAYEAIFELLETDVWIR